MSFPRYRSYQDSGVECLGGAPASQPALGVGVWGKAVVFAAWALSRLGNRRSGPKGGAA